MKYIVIKVPKSNDYSYEKTLSIFSSIKAEASKSFIAKLTKKTNSVDVSISLHILGIHSQIYFVMGINETYINFLSNLVFASFKNADVKEIDSIEELGFNIDSKLKCTELSISNKSIYNLKTIEKFNDVDPLTSILSLITRTGGADNIFWLQIIAKPLEDNYSKKLESKIMKLNSVIDTPKDTAQIHSITEKIKYNLFECSMRILHNYDINGLEVATAFNIFTDPQGAEIKVHTKNIQLDNKLLETVRLAMLSKKPDVINALELSTIWHMPSERTNIANIVWGKKFNLEPPENLPVTSKENSEEDRKDMTYMGKALYRNKFQVFGTTMKDRMLHTYIVGKTGSGKSWLMNNLAIEDIRKGHGVAVLDPHGSAIETIIQYIPKHRIRDVCYFNPSDPDFAYPLNLLEIPNKHQKELMVSNIIQIFYKLYSHSWGPRMEHILRNVLITLANVENSTLVDIIKILTDTKYRNKIIKQIDDPHILRFWEREFNTMPEKMREESISPILNKVGQFVSSPLVRKIIQWPKSKVKIEEIMNSGKILLCDLSNGKIGEDNATLLGSMIITQIQITAMNRTYMKDESMKPFFLYVDEFQNFATQSFTKILSEARKYKLGLTLANQYISQIDEDIMGAVFGNIGTLISFNVGAKDSEILASEFGNNIKPEDLTTLDKYQMITRLSINLITSQPFTCYSMPLPKNISGHKDKIIDFSRKNFGVKISK